MGGGHFLGLVMHPYQGSHKIVCRLRNEWEASQQRHPLGPPLDVSYSCTSGYPLGARHMAQPGTDQHERRIAIQKTAHHMGTATDLTVQPFNGIIGTDASPMFTRKIAVSQRFFNAGYTGALKAPVRCFGNHLSGKGKSSFQTDNECSGAAILKK